MTDRKVNQLEDYLQELIMKTLRQRELEINEADAKMIVTTIINEVDEMVSARIKQHFIEIADFIKDKFSEEKT